jgi:hypothetical protein
MTVHLLLAIGELDDIIGAIFVVVAYLHDDGSKVIALGRVVEDVVTYVELGECDDGCSFIWVLLLDLGCFQNSIGSSSLGNECTQVGVGYWLFCCGGWRFW